MRILSGAVVVLIGLAVSSTVRAEGQLLDHVFDGEFGLATTIAKGQEGFADDTGTGVGVHVRASGSLFQLFTVNVGPPIVPGYTFSDWNAFEVGFGYGSNDELSGAWMDFRVELGLRALYSASDNFELFSRGGYITAINSAGRWSYDAYDALFATGGFRLGRVVAEVGYGVSTGLAREGDTYLLLDLDYRADDLGMATALLGASYIGVRIESISGDSNDLLNIRLTVGSH